MMDKIIDYLAILCVFLIPILLIVAIAQESNRCEERFGQGWSSRRGLYGPTICVNEQGDVRAP